MARTKEEIEQQIDESGESIEKGGKFNGMSYEEGVRAALEWVVNYTDTKPMED
jgi:hypothetical protein